MMNSQEELYDENYEELLALLNNLMHSAIRGTTSVKDLTSISSYLVDVYTSSFLSEAETIVDELGVELNEIEWRNLQNGVDTSEFARANKKRIEELLANRVEQINELRNNQADSGITDEELERRALNIVLLLATSELHMAVEKASVVSGKLIQEITNTSIKKRWNSVLDERTCATCKALHGLEIPIEASFQQYVNNVEIEEELDYTGGDIPYAHPRCRCWLTYST